MSENETYNYIKGYTIYNDINSRKLQLKAIHTANPWYLLKVFDIFGSIGPKTATEDEIGDPHNLKIELSVNEQVRQSINTKYLLFKISFLVEYISSFITLEPDDIITTGTPGRIGPILL